MSIFFGKNSICLLQSVPLTFAGRSEGQGYGNIMDEEHVQFGAMPGSVYTYNTMQSNW